MPNCTHTHKHTQNTHAFIFHQWERVEAAVARDTPESERGRLPLPASHWAQYLCTAAMFRPGDLAPTQPHFLCLHAHLYLTTAGRWLKAPACFNSAITACVKIETWLWDDVNRSNLAHTLVWLEGVLRRIWMHFGGSQGVDCCSDGQADTQRDRWKRQTDRKAGGRIENSFIL